ncbi:uncharacterized protein C8Q71DRAFT_722016 [Rhodofomes roseus]|uniref:Uncharacterized protein n=1 Tax=Rhodofomes roseus TaxID=34475 RepID=A0ABQ8KPI2_9APHY|nr:uncharacterized protein C8Q71DRAFT_722016 [Rhodofomes roseus]KAH9840330.1 hypothetical protein C8Q71DRAFT_722016 [Rhodofomes roseus]
MPAHAAAPTAPSDVPGKGISKEEVLDVAGRIAAALDAPGPERPAAQMALMTFIAHLLTNDRLQESYWTKVAASADDGTLSVPPLMASAYEQLGNQQVGFRMSNIRADDPLIGEVIDRDFIVDVDYGQQAARAVGWWRRGAEASKGGPSSAAPTASSSAAAGRSDAAEETMPPSAVEKGKKRVFAADGVTATALKRIRTEKKKPPPKSKAYVETSEDDQPLQKAVGAGPSKASMQAAAAARAAGRAAQDRAAAAKAAAAAERAKATKLAEDQAAEAAEAALAKSKMASGGKPAEQKTARPQAAGEKGAQQETASPSKKKADRTKAGGKTVDGPPPEAVEDDDDLVEVLATPLPCDSCRHARQKCEYPVNPKTGTTAGRCGFCSKDKGFCSLCPRNFKGLPAKNAGAGKMASLWREWVHKRIRAGLPYSELAFYDDRLKTAENVHGFLVDLDTWDGQKAHVDPKVLAWVEQRQQAIRKGKRVPALKLPKQKTILVSDDDGEKAEQGKAAVAPPAAPAHDSDVEIVEATQVDPPQESGAGEEEEEAEDEEADEEDDDDDEEDADGMQVDVDSMQVDGPQALDAQDGPIGETAPSSLEVPAPSVSHDECNKMLESLARQLQDERQERMALAARLEKLERAAEERWPFAQLQTLQRVTERLEDLEQNVCEKAEEIESLNLNQREIRGHIGSVSKMSTNLDIAKNGVQAAMDATLRRVTDVEERLLGKIDELHLRLEAQAHHLKVEAEDEPVDLQIVPPPSPPRPVPEAGDDLVAAMPALSLRRLPRRAEVVARHKPLSPVQEEPDRRVGPTREFRLNPVNPAPPVPPRFFRSPAPPAPPAPPIPFGTSFRALGRYDTPAASETRSPGQISSGSEAADEGSDVDMDEGLDPSE